MCRRAIDRGKWWNYNTTTGHRPEHRQRQDEKGQCNDNCKTRNNKIDDRRGGDAKAQYVCQSVELRHAILRPLAIVVAQTAPTFVAPTIVDSTSATASSLQRAALLEFKERRKLETKLGVETLFIVHKNGLQFLKILDGIARSTVEHVVRKGGELLRRRLERARVEVRGGLGRTTRRRLQLTSLEVGELVHVDGNTFVGVPGRQHNTAAALHR